MVFGAGAVGSRFAAALARAGSDVTIVARPEHVASVTAEGLQVDGDSRPPARLPAVDR
ncbi:MAG: NAD-binding protein, partial [Thermoplasmata archaeon]|nr:NAD-binding protein [Thermoplasmata archaeon]